VDWLALERNELANERTLLAWLRTALGLIAAGATLVRFGSVEHGDTQFGLAIVGVGIGAGVAGVLRYLRVARRHRSWRASWSDDRPAGGRD
jgi:putative membrane protein